MTKRVLGWLAAASLLACLAVPLLHFIGRLGAPAYEKALAGVSLGWFVSATAWSAKR